MATKTDEGIANFEKVDMTVNSELKVDNSSQTIKLTASDVLGNECKFNDLYFR